MKNSFKIIIVVVAIVSAALGFYYTQKPEKIQWKEIVAENKDFDVTISSTGSVQPEHRIQITPPVSGRVDKILIKEGDKVKTGQIIAWMSSADRAAILDAARSQGATELKKWEDMYRPTPIVSPSSGNIIALNIVPGQTVVESLVAFELSDRLIISAQVDESDIGQIKVGLKASIKIDAYPADSIETQVVRISEQSVTSNSVNVFNVLLVPTHEVPFLKSGMTASVQFVIYHKDNAVVLPTWIAEGKENVELSLNKKGPQGEAIPIKVNVGRSNGDKIEVLSGLEAGDTLLYKPVQIMTEAPKGLMGGMLQKKKK